jgi:hypothetical protein
LGDALFDRVAAQRDTGGEPVLDSLATPAAFIAATGPRAIAGDDVTADVNRWAGGRPEFGRCRAGG